MDYGLLKKQEALNVTESVFKGILSLPTKQEQVQAFLNWQGQVTAITMQISAERSIDSIDTVLKTLVYSNDRKTIDILLEQRNGQEKQRLIGKENYSEYVKKLAESGIKFV